MSPDVLIALVFWLLVAWGIWWLFGRRIKGHFLWRALRSRWQARRVPEEAYYTQAAEEIRRGELRTGLWAKAWADAKGDQARAEARYIELRVDAIRKQVAERLYTASCEDTSQVSSEETRGDIGGSTPKGNVTCPRCSARLRVPERKVLDVSCPKCALRFRAET